MRSMSWSHTLHPSHVRLWPRNAAQEMSTVQAELKFAEQKLRYQMKEELELQLQFQEKRCADKVAFIRTKADAHVAHVRKASQAIATTEIVKTRREERVAREAVAHMSISNVEKRHAEEILQLNELQRQYIVRMQELQIENKNLHARIRTHDEAISTKEHEARRIQQRDVQVISSLEQQLAAKEGEIQMLRDQLAAVKLAPPDRSAPAGTGLDVTSMPAPKSSTLQALEPSSAKRLTDISTAKERSRLLAGVGGLEAPAHSANGGAREQPQLKFSAADALYDDDDDDSEQQ